MLAWASLTIRKCGVRGQLKNEVSARYISARRPCSRRPYNVLTVRRPRGKQGVSAISAGPAATRMVVAASTLDPLCLGRRCFLALPPPHRAGGNVRRMYRGLSAVACCVCGLCAVRGACGERRGRRAAKMAISRYRISFRGCKTASVESGVTGFSKAGSLPLLIADFRCDAGATTRCLKFRIN